MSILEANENPFHLTEDNIRWVEETFNSLSLKEKVGQLFCPMVEFMDDETIQKILDEIKPGGMMIRARNKKEMRRAHASWQARSAVPLLIPANMETGGNGAAEDGTAFSTQMGVAATDSSDIAYKFGLVCGREARAVGVNWTFSPVVDIDMNPFNPITNVRTYGSHPDRVFRMAEAYTRGVKESGVAVTVKHWPGDGVDDRDQHLVMTKNSLDMEQWLLTYGRVYRELIVAGVQSVMCAHIAFPAYMKKLKPGIDPKDILPATLTPELNFNLLRRELGFKGLIVSDATNMVGLCAKGNRRDIVPTVVASGCDIFLFNKNCFEDFGFMLKGIDSGILSKSRLDEAVLNILAMKASLGLHDRRQNGDLVPSGEKLDIVGCREHEEWSRECADHSITLVKDSQNLIPITPEVHRKVLLIGVGGLKEMFSDRAEPVTGEFKALLEKEGFEVTEFDARRMGFEMLGAPVEKFREKYDLVIYLAVIAPHSNVGSLRIPWIPPLGFDAPWFVCEVPTLFISCANPYHFYDVPDIRTVVNTYSYSTTILEELVRKITGKAPFRGISPVDPFCGLEEAAL